MAEARAERMEIARQEKLAAQAARKAALAGMKQILGALRTHDGERARRVMREHLDVARGHLRRVLDDIRRETAAGPAAAAPARP